MSKKVKLSEVLDYLDGLGGEIAKDKPLVDLQGIIPQADHHQTVVFIRTPYPEALEHQKVKDRVLKFLGSLNKPETIKADVFTICGANVLPGYAPNIKHAQVDGKEVKGPLFNPDWIVASSEMAPWVLQITVDIVHPTILGHVLGDTSEEVLYEKFANAKSAWQSPGKAKAKIVSIQDLVGIEHHMEPNPQYKPDWGSDVADFDPDDAFGPDDDDDGPEPWPNDEDDDPDPEF